jgi:GT2 family glycosyltransferase
MDLSIVVVTWNSSEYIAGCLSPVESQQGGLTTEIIVVDNASSDGTAGIVRKRFPHAHLIVNAENLGFTRACNLGLKKAAGRFVLVLNPDTSMRPGALMKMVEYIDGHPRAGALGPQLLNPDGSIQPSCRRFPSYRLMLWEFTGLSKLFPDHPVFGAWRMGSFDHREIRTVDQPMGACLLLRREALDQIGLMDERFTMFFNDVDLCRRLSSVGWDIVFLPQARVIHDAGSHVRRARYRMILTSHQDCLRYFRKIRCGPLDELNSVLLGCGLYLSLAPRFLFTFLRRLLTS